MSMKVVSFLNPKGGSGKTTAVINVSTAMARAGYNIAVVDTDPQMSLTNWSKSGKAAFDVFTAASAAVMVSDLVIIPVTPSPLDFSAAGSVVTVLEAQAYSRKVEARFLITRKIEQATMLNVLKESIKDTGVKPFRTAITQRQIYVKSILDGDSVFESNDGAAKGEVEILTKEIVKVFE